MPYVTKTAREELTDYTGDGRPPVTAGELNYKFTMLAKNYFEDHPNYQGINDVLGALEGCKLEFYRRVTAPYEDRKIQENGDVY